MGKLSVREMALFGMLGALTFAAKYVMAPLPNIEPVSLCVMLYAVTFDRKSVYPIGLYILMEILFFGLGVWNVMYLYIWFVLALAAAFSRQATHPLYWAVLSGGFGLCFGALCIPVDLVVGGGAYAVAKWISGIPFDLAHCAGNFVIALTLFAPMRKMMKKLNQ